MKDISIWDIKALINEQKEVPYHLIDVRTFREHEARHIPGSICIPMHHLENPEIVSELQELSTSKPVCLYCEHAERSAIAKTYLEEQGLQNITHIKEGFYLWNII